MGRTYLTLISSLIQLLVLQSYILRIVNASECRLLETSKDGETDICIKGSEVNNVAFSESIINHKIVGPVISSNIATDERDCELACFMAVPNKCSMINYYPATKKCQLLYKNQPEKYRVEKEKGCNLRTHECVNNPCGERGLCYTIGKQPKCFCKLAYNGTFCDQRIDVCIGAKDEDFAAIFAPKDGKIKSIKLIHTTGGVAVMSDPRIIPGNWGSVWNDDKKMEGIELFVTDNAKTRITPPTAYEMIKGNHYAYVIPGYDVNSPEIVFPDIHPSIEVTKGQTFRIWFGQDLYDYSESNNIGKTCAVAQFIYDN